MPTTRAARRAARCLTEVLPADALSLVLYQLTLAHDIAAVAPTCHVLCNAVKLTMKLRPFSGEVVTLAGHTARIRAVAVAPAGQIITGSYDGNIKVWRDGVCERTIQHAHANDIKSVAMLPCGTRFISVAEDDTVKLWTLDGSREEIILSDLEHPVWSIAALPDGAHFVFGLGGGSGDVMLYHVDGTLVHSFEDHRDTVWSVAVTPDGQHIISGSFDRTAKVWSVANKSLVSTCGVVGNEDDAAGHTNSVRAVAAMPDGQRILSGGGDATVRVWLLDGTLENTFQLHASAVTALVALPDNQHALSGSYDNAVKLFNVDDGAVLRTFWHHTGPVLSLALLPDGLRFVSGAQDYTARIVYHGLAPQ
jgi:WD40 repeat protein